MENTDANAKKALTFPLPWQYRIVVEASVPGMPEALQAAFAAVGLGGVEVVPTKASGAGKYQSYSVRTEFQSEAQMKSLDTALGQIPGVKFVL